MLVAFLIAATLPAAHPPPATVSGVHVSWPKQARLARGSTVKVKIRSSHRSAQLSLSTVTSAGKTKHVLTRRTLKHGTFSAKLSSAGTYALRLTVDHRRYWSWLTVAATPSPSPSPAPSPTPVPSPSPIPGSCTDQPGPASARMVLGKPSTSVGGTMPYRITNTSTDCITEGAAYGLARQADDGSWQAIQTGPFPDYAVLVQPGQPYSKTAQIPADAQPGRYRLTDSFGGLTADFNVTAT